MAIPTNSADGENGHGGAAPDGRRRRLSLPDHFRVEGEVPAAPPARFAATDIRTGERIFVKWDPDPSTVRREAEVLSAVEGPGVPRIKDWRDDPGAAWLAMEYVAGPDLETVLAESGGELDATEIAGLLGRLTDAVGAIHAKGFAHRDLKPANIVMRHGTAPVIVDFGAARPLGTAGGSSDQSFLTEGYGAPEQYLTDTPEGAWTDIYALGAIAYRALTGKAPPPARQRLVDRSGSLVRDLPENCPAELRRSIGWALRLDPEDRPRSVAAWRETLSAPEPENSPTTRLVAAFDPRMDDYPPTIPVRRVPLESVAPAAAAARSDPPATGGRRSRGPMVAALLLCGLAAILAAAAWQGWPLYEKYLKHSWTVDPGGDADAATISDALSRAGPGAVISIAPGTYAESLAVDYPVELLAAVADDPPVVSPAEGPCLVSANSGAVVTNLRLGVPVASEPPPSPVACVVVAGGRLTLRDSHVSSEQGPAIVIQNGADPAIGGNTIEGGAGIGIVVASGATGTISGNTLKDLDKQSMVVRSGAAPDIADNTIESSGGVVYSEGAAGTFRGNRILSARANAIEVTMGADPLVAGNTVTGAAEAAVFVYAQGRGRLEGNTIAASGLSGVVVSGDARPVLAGNSIRDNGEHGVLVLDRSNAVLEGNTIEGNKGHAVVIGPVSDVELKDNAVAGNKDPQVLDTRPPK